MAYYPRIRDLREDNDKKQTELAEYLGTTAQYYGLYEKGANEISFERAILLAKYYNVSLDYIAGLTNRKTPLTHSDLTQEQIEILDLIDELSSKKRTKLSEILKFLINILKE